MTNILPSTPLFEERQFQGLNRHSLLRRLLLAVFCFVAYYWSENPKPVRFVLFSIGEYPGGGHSGQLFFLLGLCIIALSIILLFILHMRTTIADPGVIIIDKLWSKRLVRIDLSGIVSAKKIRLKASFFNRPVFNLHAKGRIRFYTHGNDAIELTAQDGTVYRIGTQRPDGFLDAIRPFLGR